MNRDFRQIVQDASCYECTTSYGVAGVLLLPGRVLFIGHQTQYQSQMDICQASKFHEAGHSADRTGSHAIIQELFLQKAHDSLNRNPTVLRSDSVIPKSFRVEMLGEHIR
jgi:hypothetical protein